MLLKLDGHRVGLIYLLVACGWGVTASANSPITDGYAGQWSYVPGETADFYFSGPENQSAELTFYDVNFEPQATITTSLSPQSIVSKEPWKDGYGFEPTQIEIPNLPSGLYHLDGEQLTSNHISFLITSDLPADVVVVYPTNTVNAYSRTPTFGDNNFAVYRNVGVNLYSVGRDGRHPPVVSFHRPQNAKMATTRRFDRWLLEQDYSFKYISDSDLESFKSISGAKLLVLPGHSEYWTETARRNFDKFVDLGGSALVISGNVMFRSVGYDDPEAPTQLTFWPRRTFVDARLDYPTWESIGADYEHAGNGSEFPGGREQIEMPYDGWKMLDVSPSYLVNTGLEVGDVLTNPTAEYDGVPHLSVDPVTGPVVDYEKLGFYRLDLIAFDNTSYGGKIPTAGTWIDFLKTEDSGRIINVSANPWTTFSGDPETTELKKRITGNMIDVLLNFQADFDGDEKLTSADINLLMREIASGVPRQRYDLTEDLDVGKVDVDRWLHDFAGTTYGDVNLNQFVGFEDFLVLRANFKKSGGWEAGDFTGDAFVDFSDFLLMGDNFDKMETKSGIVDWTCSQVSNTTSDEGGDVNGDGSVNVLDVLLTVEHRGGVMGDVNLDGDVGFSDFLVLRSNLGESGKSWSDGDLNCSGSVSFDDYLLLVDSIGSHASVRTVPVAIGGKLGFLLAVAIAILLVRRRVR